MILRAPDGTLTPDWSERLLEEFAVLQLAVESFRSIHTLEEAAQADLRTFIGWSRRSEGARDPRRPGSLAGNGLNPRTRSAIEYHPNLAGRALQQAGQSLLDYGS
jgi:hypothetical protein